MGDTAIGIEEIIGVVNDVLNDEIITVDDIERNLITDFALDSLVIVELIMALEEFGIQIDDEDLLIENFSTVKSIYQIINK